MARLGDVCTINPKSPRFQDDLTVSFVPMPKVGENGEFDPSDVKTYQEVRKGFTYFQNGDVLFAKITPCMENGKGAIAQSLENGIGFGSTEFHVLRPIPAYITSKWLFYLLSWPVFRKEAEKSMTGSAGQKRVPKSFLEKFMINVPDLNTQAKMTDTLDTVCSLISLREQQLSKLDDLVRAQFVEMFGDPVHNTNSLPAQPLSELGTLDRGRSKHRPRNDPELLNGPYPLIQTGEIANSGLYITSYKNTYSELGLRQSKMWNKGTLCIPIAANIAQTAILAFDACFPDSVVGFIPNEGIRAIYIHYWFSFFQKILEEQAPQVAQKNINLQILSELRVMVPPLEIQDCFVEFVTQTNRKKLTIQQSLDKLIILKKSLMQEYFG